MEPVTHVLVGACLARSGPNRRAAYAVGAMAIAAEFPDIDTLWGLRGPIAGFEHHRGITHTLVGIPVEGALLLLGWVVYHRLRHRSVRSPSLPHSRIDRRSDAAVSAVPVRWGVLYACILLALASHLLLDYTNNYGLRPFFPFNRHWYAGSLVFIFDPLLFILLAAGLLLPSLFTLVSREIGAHKERFPGRGWARAALGCMVLLWAGRAFEHGRAVRMAQGQVVRAPASPETADAEGNTPQTSGAESDTAASVPPAPAFQSRRSWLVPERSVASPDPLNPFRWYTATDYGSVYQTATADTWSGTLAGEKSYRKPEETAAIGAARTSHLGRVFLDWSSMPVLRSTGGAPPDLDLSPQEAADATTTRFTDLRFMADTPLLHQGSNPPLAGTVVVSGRGQVLAEGMNGKYGR